MKEVIFEPHPVSPERKAALRAKGYRIIDAIFAPKGHASQIDDRVPYEQERALLIEELEARGIAYDDSMANDELRALTITDPDNDPVDDGLDAMSAEELHALAKDRDVKVHHAAGADKVREALRAAQE